MANLVNPLLLSLIIFLSQEECPEFNTDLNEEARVLPLEVHCRPCLHDVSLGLFLAHGMGFLLPYCKWLSQLRQGASWHSLRSPVDAVEKCCSGREGPAVLLY